MSRGSSAARIGAQTTPGCVVVVADSSAVGSSSAWADRRLDHRPHPPRSTGHPSRGVSARSDRMFITNGSVVPMNDAGDVLFGGALAIEGDRIVDVGDTAEVLARH